MRTSGSSSARSARSRPSSASRAGNRAGGRPRPKVTAGVVEEGVTDPGGVRARAIAHVDMDAFYAAIEQRDRSELRGSPLDAVRRITRRIRDETGLTASAGL